MDMRIVVLLAVVCAVAAIPRPMPGTNAKGGVDWAVLVAGSNTWGNYRHQADVCHAYQVLHNAGLPDSRIIVFMYDDLAQNAENPTPGIVINHLQGKDVYHGVLHDYTRDTVTPENFINVIKGNAAAMKGIGSGRVLQSGPNDNVFINFVDHGGPGIIAFPSEMLQATTLNAALQYMHDNSMYSELVFYLEACESGSMFDGLLPANINIFATTASDPTSSSYACYYDNTRQTYLGDVYSVNWMEDSDIENLQKETLTQQYNIVKRETTTSTVCEYGDMSIGSQVVAEFFGAAPFAASETPRVDPNVDAVDSRDVPVEILKRKIAATKCEKKLAVLSSELVTLLAERAAIKQTYADIVAAAGADVDTHMAANVKPRNFECLDAATSAFHKACYNYAQFTYAMKFAKAFTSMCESGVGADTIVSAINVTCAKPVTMI